MLICELNKQDKIKILDNINIRDVVIRTVTESK